MLKYIITLSAIFICTFGIYVSSEKVWHPIKVKLDKVKAGDGRQNGALKESKEISLPAPISGHPKFYYLVR